MLPDALAGHDGRCAACGEALRAPGERREPATLRAGAGGPAGADRGGVRLVTASARGAAAPITKARRMVEFPCPGCQKTLRAVLDAAGKEARCAHCQATFPIPAAPGDEDRAGPAAPDAVEAPPAPPPGAPPPAQAPSPGAPGAPAGGRAASSAAAALDPAPQVAAVPRPGSDRSPRLDPPGAPPRAGGLVARVRCGCGRSVAAPRAQLERGDARCPSCDAVLAPE